MTKVTHLTADEHGGLNRQRIHLREISGDADAPLETVGQDLRAARMRRGDDLATVSRALKIRKDHLEAIEENRLEALPGRAYAVGFLRSYADYLGLDPVAAVERFKGEIAGRSDGSYQIALSPITDDRRLPHGWIVIAIVLLAVIGYGGYRLAKSADTLVQPVAPVPARISPPPVASFSRHLPETVLLRNSMLPPPAATNPAVGQPALARQGIGSAALTVTNAAGVGNGTPAISPSAAPGSLASPASPDTLTAALPAGEEFGRENRGARVVLRVQIPTRILVQGADGTVFINRVFHPGDSYRVPGKAGLTLTTPDGGAVGLELDGRKMGAAGSGGRVIEALSLDPQAIVDRYSGGNHD